MPLSGNLFFLCKYPFLSQIWTTTIFFVDSSTTFITKDQKLDHYGTFFTSLSFHYTQPRAPTLTSLFTVKFSALKNEHLTTLLPITSCLRYSILTYIMNQTHLLLPSPPFFSGKQVNHIMLQNVFMNTNYL